MVLAVCNLGGSNTGKDAMMNNILASNMYSFYQAKNVRQTHYKLAVDELEIQLAADKLSPASKQLLQDKVAAYKKTIERYGHSMAYVSFLLGIVGSLCTLNGYFLFF